MQLRNKPVFLREQKFKASTNLYLDCKRSNVAFADALAHPRPKLMTILVGLKVGIARVKPQVSLGDYLIRNRD
jgi:hypothetical protein